MSGLYDLPPRVELDLTGLAGTQVTVMRTDANGNTAPVRSANPAPLSGGEWVGYDYECPFGIEVWYTATTDTGATETVGPLALVVTECWLIHPGIPMVSQKITIASLDDPSSSTNQGVFQVLGRANPVVISDGIRHGSTFQMVLKTDDPDSEAALRTLLGDTSVLLLQRAYPFTERRDYWWIAIGDVVQHDLTDDWSVQSIRWTLSCTVTDAPFGTLQATWTWDDLAGDYASWQDVIDAFPTWRDVVTDTPAV